MCYAIPGKIIEVKGKTAVVDYFGEKRNVLNEFENVQKGDYVYAQGGIIVDKVPEKDAVEILNVWKEKFFELKKIDSNLAQIKKTRNSQDNLLGILQKINLENELSKRELSGLLKINGKSSLKLLYATANNIRQKERDNACCVHGIIEFSNYCKNDCLYCGIRRNRRIKRYRMEPDEIISVAKYAVTKLGFKALVLQSGEDYWYDDEKLYEIVKEIRKLNVLIFLSIGIRSKNTYQALYEAGARAVLLRFETSNKKLFNKLRPKTSFEERLNLIRFIKKTGYILATGFLIGLPGETDGDIINNILLTKSLKADMYSFGPLIPVDGTKKHNLKPVHEECVLSSKRSPREQGSNILDSAYATNHQLTRSELNTYHEEIVLKTISISRFVDRNSKILVTSAFETLGKDAKMKGLLAGANSLMINVTPQYYRKLYELYPGRADRDKEIPKNIKETIDLLYSLGRAPTDLGV